MVVEQDTTRNTSGEEGVAAAAFFALHGRQGGILEGVRDCIKAAEIERAAGIALLIR